MTHQVSIIAKTKIVSSLATALHKRHYSKFDELWIPDHNGTAALAPALSSYSGKIPAKYLGPITRMQYKSGMRKYRYDLAIILSGPEPQRTILERILVERVMYCDKQIAIVRGTNQTKLESLPDHIHVFDMLTTERLTDIIYSSRRLLCRAGYSSIMDLVQMKVGATLIPTPGQYEQEYLAKVLDGRYGFTCMLQEAIKDNLRI